MYFLEATLSKLYINLLAQRFIYKKDKKRIILCFLSSITDYNIR